ncbi:hypothetical protein GCM10022222_42370 [Amycolatopsis ultiminotia]|uniref:Uncharacterized protein n=1 Tax=Amycolatopsis ultiminotia TaxID=543629 RepID=A0ABP6WNL4_9PSEU
MLLFGVLREALAPILEAAVGAAVSLVLGMLGIRQRPSNGQERDEPQRPTLNDRINELRDNLASSAFLIDEINAELQLQTTALDRIRAEAEENQRLAELNKAQADAVREVMSKTLNDAQRKAASKGSKQQWLFFGAGLAFSVPLGVVVNFLYDVIAH